MFRTCSVLFVLFLALNSCSKEIRVSDEDYYLSFKDPDIALRYLKHLNHLARDGLGDDKDRMYLAETAGKFAAAHPDLPAIQEAYACALLHKEIDCGKI